MRESANLLGFQLDRTVRDDFSDEVTFWQRPEGGEKVRHAEGRRESVPGRAPSKHQAQWECMWPEEAGGWPAVIQEDSRRRRDDSQSYGTCYVLVTTLDALLHEMESWRIGRRTM